MKALPFRIAWIISLLLAAGLTSLWIRSYRHYEDFTFSTTHARFRFPSVFGRLIIIVPPPHGPAAQEKKAWALLQQLNNDQIQWDEREHDVTPQPIAGTAAAELETLGLPNVLMRGLDDPKKFAAAYVLLMRLQNRALSYSQQLNSAHGLQSGDSLICRFGILQVEILHYYDTYGPLTFDPRHAGVRHYRSDEVKINPNQIALVKEYWDHQLGRDLAVIRYPWLIPGLLVLPLVALRRAWIHTLRRRRGHCLHCGYDLRQSPERCPECGAAAPQNVARAACP